MKTRFFRDISVISLVLFGLAPITARAQAPHIDSLSRTGQMVWSLGYDGQTSRVARVEVATNLTTPVWTPFYFDFVSTNMTTELRRQPIAFDPPSNVLRTTPVPTNWGAAFFRIGVQTNPPDPSLVLHLSFDNDFSRGVILDSSGHGNHGLRYGRTNWPSLILGPDGSRAGEFHTFPDSDPTYFNAGDYVSILRSPSLDNLTNGTIAVWARYYAGLGGTYANDSRATLIDAAYGENVGSWSLGRENNNLTTFLVYTFTNGGAALYFPDATVTGDTARWHLYVITFDGVRIRGYFDAELVDVINNIGSMRKLDIGGADADYIALGTWAHGGTPQYRDDQYPNCCWMNGGMDDVRIYNRALNTGEIAALYFSMDKQPPGVPAGVKIRPAASNQVELRWNASLDNFAVDGYEIRRDGVVVGTSSGPSFVDTGLVANTTYAYTVAAFDGSGNRSAPSPVLLTNTPAAGGPVAVIIDDEDGSERVEIQGTWSLSAIPGGASYRSTFHLGTQNSGAQSVIYYPVLPGPGDYGVYFWYSGATNGGTPNYIWADNVPVDVVHAGTTNTVVVNQQQGYGTWVFAGTFPFAGAANEYIRIRTDGTAGHGQGYVAADAVMLQQ